LLYFLSQFSDVFGPLRLLNSHLFLGGIGVVLCWILSFTLLPRFMDKLPTDRGREFAIDASKSIGKPTGAGIIFISVFLLVQILVLPLNQELLAILFFTFLAMMGGWLDDKSDVAWGRVIKGSIDLILCLGTMVVITKLEPFLVWFPFTKFVWMTPAWISIPCGTVLIWVAINSTNCSDGVDGLSGTLATIALTALGALMYFILGHAQISSYLLLPHTPDGAVWAIMAFSLVGTLIGYLWYNAYPSILLMGDAGSRAIGYLLGVFIIQTGNPFLIFIVSGVLLINGGTGLVKVALLAFFKIAIFKNIRFPLHDHVRHNHGWSASQVLMRFSILQLMLTIILLILLIKIR
jgi:phospho-N-acetylmuramoyl-pentapeptide-transferase